VVEGSAAGIPLQHTNLPAQSHQTCSQTFWPAMPSFFFHLAIVCDLPNTSHQSTDVSGNVKPTATTKYPSSTIEETRVVPTTQKFSNHANRDLERTVAIPLLTYDWRCDKILFQDIHMTSTKPLETQGQLSEHSGAIVNGISAEPGGLATKGRFEPCDPGSREVGWGIVRLYRDAAETPGLYDEIELSKHPKNRKHVVKSEQEERPFSDEDCTTLCILAVPSYLTPSDFLGFVGEKTRDGVSHFRMIRTERSNRYMVLLRFRNGRKAREWRKEWDGKAFDAMEVGRIVN